MFIAHFSRFLRDAGRAVVSWWSRKWISDRAPGPRVPSPAQSAPPPIPSFGEAALNNVALWNEPVPATADGVKK